MKRILIIEDDQKIALAIAVRLKANGYEVHTAYDALTGLDAAVKLRPDLLILDISLPGGSGFDVAEKIRNIISTSSTPVIFVTASRKPEFVTRAAALGAVAFILKPFSNGELLSDVRHALGEDLPAK
ncbi:MAG: response regulator transcription factor [bacterium]